MRAILRRASGVRQLGQACGPPGAQLPRSTPPAGLHANCFEEFREKLHAHGAADAGAAAPSAMAAEPPAESRFAAVGLVVHIFIKQIDQIIIIN